MDDILDDKKAEKGGLFFSCEHCYYNTCELSKFNRHILTDKHKRMTNGLHLGGKKAEKAENENKFVCICGCSYKYRQGLWKHRKSCIDFIKIENPNLYQETEKKEPTEIAGLDANFLNIFCDKNLGTFL